MFCASDCKIEKSEIKVNLGDEEGYIDSKHTDGEYINLFNDQKVIIKDGKLPLIKDPVIIKK